MPVQSSHLTHNIFSLMEDNKKRGGADRIGDTPAPVQPIANPGEWWKSTNFALTVVLFIAGFFGLESLDFNAAAKEVVLLVYKLVGTVGALRVFIVNAKFNPKKWLGNSNSYQYLIAILTTFIPQIPADAGTYLADLIAAIKTGNLQIIVPMLFSFAVWVWNVWKASKAAKVAAPVLVLLVIHLPVMV